MKLRTKFLLVGLFHSILQFILIFSFAWLNDCLLEMAITYVCFFYFRTKFEKQYHALTSWGCTFITMIVYYIISLITPDKSISILLVIILTYFINYCSFIYRDYRDIKALRTCKQDEINDKKNANIEKKEEENGLFKNNFNIIESNINNNNVIVKKKKNTNRKLIIEILGADKLDEESIEAYCVSKGMPKLSETIYLFLNNTLEETADILDVDTSTVTRRIKRFIENGLKED